MTRPHFRLTCVTQKRLCLSSLMKNVEDRRCLDSIKERIERSRLFLDGNERRTGGCTLPAKPLLEATSPQRELWFVSVLYYSNLFGHVPPSKPMERGSTVIINHKFQKAGDTLQTLRLINLTLALATAFSTASLFCPSNCFMSCAFVASNATFISSLRFAFHSCRAISTATAKYSPQKGIEFRLYLS